MNQTNNSNGLDEGRTTTVLENGTRVTRVPNSEVFRFGSFVRPDFREVNRRNLERLKRENG
tara:strand:+ start:332 stop:514 length:183 start_codon:yes stop_codon:yes gene_type:complete